MNNTKGQNVVEYVLLVTAVLLVCLFFFRLGGPMATGVNATLNSVVNQINNINGQIKF